MRVLFNIPQRARMAIAVVMVAFTGILAATTSGLLVAAVATVSVCGWCDLAAYRSPLVRKP